MIERQRPASTALILGALILTPVAVGLCQSPPAQALGSASAAKAQPVLLAEPRILSVTVPKTLTEPAVAAPTARAASSSPKSQAVPAEPSVKAPSAKVAPAAAQTVTVAAPLAEPTVKPQKSTPAKSSAASAPGPVPTESKVQAAPQKSSPAAKPPAEPRAGASSTPRTINAGVAGPMASVKAKGWTPSLAQGALILGAIALGFGLLTREHPDQTNPRQGQIR